MLPKDTLASIWKQAKRAGQPNKMDWSEFMAACTLVRQASQPPSAATPITRTISDAFAEDARASGSSLGESAAPARLTSDVVQSKVRNQ